MQQKKINKAKARKSDTSTMTSELELVGKPLTHNQVRSNTKQFHLTVQE